MNRTMGDSTAVTAIPATVDIAAYYINGRYAAISAQVEARFPRTRYGHCQIDVTGARADTADVLDVENGDATPATASLWCQSWHKLRRPGLPVLYVNRSNRDSVVSSCDFGGLVLGRDYGLWIATLDGTQLTGPGIVACQSRSALQTGGNWDESVVYDDSLWRPATAAPPPVPQPTMAELYAMVAGERDTIAAISAKLDHLMVTIGQAAAIVTRGME